MDLVLLFVGPEGDIKYRDLMNEAHSQGIGDRVICWGVAEGGEKTWLFQRADTFALPSRNENFGVAVAEAMLAGCPVITTSAVASSEHLRAAGTGIVLNEYSIEALTEAIIASVDGGHPNASTELGMNYARQNLTWEAAAMVIAGELGRHGRE